MKSWIAVVLCTLAGKTVLAEITPAFVEDVRGAQRIVSGWESEVGQFPYQLSIRVVRFGGGVASCGAALIHNEWALTAAHCTGNRYTIVIRAGATNLTRPEYIFESTTWYSHPLFVDELAAVTQPNDISILKLDRFLPFSDNIQPIRLQRSADMNKNYEGVRLTASGWGMTSTGGSSPEVMHWVYLTGTTNEDCFAAYGGNTLITASTICASAYNVSSQSTCSGDSGGPLTVVDEDGQLSLVGITSFVSGTGCHTPVPAGFVRPGHYHDWISEVTGINFDWELEERPDTPLVVPAVL